MQRHIKILAVLHIANGAFILLGGLGALFALGAIGQLFGHLRHAVGYIQIADIGILNILASFWFYAVIITAPLFIGLPGIIAGWGLYYKRNWSRILVLILGIVNLPNFPLGTALGVYTLWVLLRPESAQLMTS